MQSVMTHSFSNTPTIDTPRSVFDRSFGHKFTMDAGKLVPFYHDDVIPGDTFNLNTTILARLSTPLYPIMDNVYLDTHYFFVPLRLIWTNARKFFGEQDNPADSIDYTLPYYTTHGTTGVVTGTVEDYLGVPPGVVDLDFSILYTRAYLMCWDEWFRDQNLQNKSLASVGDAAGTVTAGTALKNRGKRHDYFTSCLPWPQKGDAVELPLGTTAPLTITGNGAPSFDGATSGTNLNLNNAASSSGASYSGAMHGLVSWNTPNLTGTADLSSATASTVNDLREAFQVQKLLERDARGGTRYSEIISNHFGVNFPDITYRPEYLGGGSQPLNVTQVAATAITGANIGDLGAYATSTGSNHSFTKSFNEHGIIIGMISARADLTYQQGLPREFTKRTRYDIYWPSLAHLGEQEVTNVEIYAQGDANDDLVFGYQERYAEYRYKPSQISGQFRSAHAATLDSWHLSQEFGSLPSLGDSFIQENPPVDRVIATPTEPHFIVDTYTSLKTARPMPVFGVPGMIDHF